MADTATTAPTPIVLATESPIKDVPKPAVPAEQNTLKRSHPEYDDKTKEELVETEKKKIQKIHEIVNQVDDDTTTIDAKILLARASTDLKERKEMISDITAAAEQVKDKVVHAAQLESEVVEINSVLKEKYVEHDEKKDETKEEGKEEKKEEGKDPLTTTTTTTTTPTTTIQ
jgi:hypothetical protein